MPFKTRHDLQGKLFGLWTVASFSHTDKNKCSWWICRCQCGTERKVISRNLVHGLTKSCGCENRRLSSERMVERNRKAEIKSGKIYGRLTVIEYTGNCDKQCHKIYRCRCECGQEVQVAGYHLNRGASKSCGCLSRELSSARASELVKSAQFNPTGYNWSVDLNGRTIALKSGYEAIYYSFLVRNDARFEYEPETFILPGGQRYTPDFYLPDSDKFVEIKSHSKHYSLGKALTFRDEMDRNVEIIAGRDIYKYLPEGMSYYAFTKNWKNQHTHPM